MSALNSLRKIGRDPSRRNEAKDYCKLHIEEILKEFSKRVLMSDGAEILDCLLNCIPTTPASSLLHRSKVIEIVLSQLRQSSAGLRLCSELVCRVCLELPRTPPATVMTLADQALHSIIHDEDANMIWRDILPECLSVLSEVGKIVHCGTEMSAADYKSQCVRTLCQCRWQERTVVQLAAMFRDMQLDREEHSQVVTKLCTVMLDLSPETVPPLLHQLLHLCSSQNMETVFAYLCHYFNLNLYGKLRSSLQDSDSTIMDVEDFGGHTVSELRECVSTCLYHALGSSEQLARVLKSWPRSQILQNPFLVEAALALADSPAHKTVCLAVVKSALQQSCQDEHKSEESVWVRSVLQSNLDIDKVLRVIIAESMNPRHITTCGLISLAFSLLATSSVMGRERLAYQCCTYGKIILVRLAKSQPETAQHILSLLADRLQDNSMAQRQCADCLQVLCKLTPNSLQCAQLCSILENCQSFGEDYRSSASVYDSVHPVLNFKSRVRDTLVMVCRKGLFSRDCSSRCLALWGFLSLLRHVRLPAGAGAGAGAGGSEGYAGSDQFSVNSYLTQISINVHTTQAGASVSNVRNESVCREVISILRRCFNQDASVKQLLYTNIYSCAKSKPSLHTPILELLYEHLIRYIHEENGLSLDKCVQMTATGASLIEPIGYLLLSIQQFLQAPDDEDSEDILATQNDSEEVPSTKYFKKKLKTHMDSLCEKYSACQLTHFDMDGEACLSDLIPESKAKSLKIQQVLQVYESLMSYKLMQWDLNSDNPATKLYALFTVYNTLLERAKVSSKVAKKGNKTLNDTTQKSQKTQKTQKGKGKERAAIKMSSLLKDKATPFKQLPCLWDWATSCRTLDLLYSEDVPWSTSEDRTQLRTRRDFHQFALTSLQSVLTSEHMSRTSLVAYCTKAATVLYKRCIVRFQDMCDFHEPTALSCVESFKECLVVAYNPQNGFKIQKFLQTVTGTETSSASVAAILEAVAAGLTQLDSEYEGETQDAASRKLTQALTLLAAMLLDKRGEGGEEMTHVIAKLEQHLRTAKIDCTQLIPSLLAARNRYTQDGRLLDDLIEKLTAVLGKIEDDESAMEVGSDMFPAIDNTNVHSVYGYVCSQVIAHCGHIEYVLSRARQLNVAGKFVTHHHTKKIENELLQMDKSVVIQTCLTGSRLSRLAGMCCQVGAGSDRALQAAVRLYTALAVLVTRLHRAPAAYVHTIRLERALATCGRRLSGTLDGLITYVESSQGARGRDKVLRDTRVVPRVVFAAEQFTKSVVLLGKKTKLNLQQYLSLGTARDFRIKAGVLEEALRGREARDDASEEPAEPDVDQDDRSTVVLSGGDGESADEVAGAEADAGVSSDDDGVRVGRKRSRTDST